MSNDVEYLSVLEAQRRHFESQFGSLESMGFEDKSKNKPISDGLDNDTNEEFKGFSSSEEDHDNTTGEYTSEESINDYETDTTDSEENDVPKTQPKVVKLDDSNLSHDAPRQSKKERKLLSMGRAPTLTEIEKKERQNRKESRKEKQQTDEEERENLDNDLKLQRLLEESHILSNKVDYSGSEPTLQTMDLEDPIGKARKKTMSSRLRKASSVNSRSGGFPKLEKMPMAIRKGMINSHKRKVTKYEEEAMNAGIILPKVRKGQLRHIDVGKGSSFVSDRIGHGRSNDNRIRDRGLKVNSVGKFSGGNLFISPKQIQGTMEHKGSRRR